jgi:tetratricopeptide (TPR) repeat protein
MKILENLVVIGSLILIPAGIIIRTSDLPGGSFFIALGLFGLFVLFIIKLIKGIKRKTKRSLLIAYAMIVLMSFSLFTKYLYHIFGDYPSLIIVPLFIINALIYLFKENEKDIKTTIVSILFLLLSIPLFGLEFNKSPRWYIPIDWYNRYDVSSGVSIDIPYGFKFPETEQLSIKAFELRESKSYQEAIVFYNKARKIEPENLRLLFDLSETYARLNNLERAITLLDTAIMIDSSFSGFYNNRGLLYYKLRENDRAIGDYEKAIQLDSTKSVFYSNLALAYYCEKSYDKSCESIQKAIKLGLDLEKHKEFKRIMKRHCK